MLIFLSGGGASCCDAARLTLRPRTGLAPAVSSTAAARGVGGSGLPAMLPGALCLRVRVSELRPPPELTEPGRARMSAVCSKRSLFL